MSERRVFRGFDHLDTRVRSLAAVRAFYDGLMTRLGLSEHRFVLVDGDEWTYVDESQPHNAVEYVEEDAPAGQARFFGVIESVTHAAGETRIAFTIAAPADFAEIERFLVSIGARNVQRSEDENVYPAIFFEDPLGNRLELLARP